MANMIKLFSFLQRKVFLTLFSSVFAVLFSLNVNAQEELFYRAQPDDTLSEILYRLNLRPIYGPHGSLQAALKLNPQKKSRNGDHIQPGERIYLPAKYVADLKELAAIKKDGEIAVYEDKKISQAPTSFEKLMTPPAPDEVRLPATTLAAPVCPEPTTPEKMVKAEEEVPNDLYLGGGYTFSNLNAQDLTTGGSAQIYSKSGFGLLAGWRIHWSEELLTFFEIKTEFLEYLPSSSTLKQIDNLSLTRTHFSLGAEQAFNTKWSAKYFASYGQEVFVRGVSSTTLHLDEVSLPSVGASASYSFLSKGRTSLSADVGGQYLFGGSTEAYTVKGGSLLSAAITARHGDRLQVSVGARERAQDTSLVKQKEDEVFAQVQFAWPFGRGDR